MKKGNRWAALLLALACAGSLAACQEVQYSAKPVVYLYPEEETQVTVQLDYAGELTCTYPAYNDGWTVTASPDGTLTDGEGQTYSYLYWEGKDNVEYDFSQGACVAGEDTAAFLEDALSQLGLTRREANEFIVYWLPRWKKTPITSSLSSPTPTRKRRSWPLPQPPTRCCGCSWPGSPWRSRWSFPRRSWPARSAAALRWWNGAAAR